MRVIAGKFRSRRLLSPAGADIRPTSDRLRESLFDILAAGTPPLAGSVWLDLFAGTGAVGIEAISRGAAMVYFVEARQSAAVLVAENLRSLGIQDGYEILRRPSGMAIRQLERRRIRPDFVFLDPPYGLHDVYRESLGELGESGLGGRAVVVAEHEKRFDPGDRFGRLRRTRKLLQGDAALSFYRQAGD
ncbi:MAG: 16S rRNA (guanine(966)-N(2))-methyltransferase RsmD [Acidobacteria bacterium]|nr:16S rRNA (guanine(966)-N(2))-methyltransferase RsmD [Acidobacteriota bacterium]